MRKKRVEMAERHVREARKMVERQKHLIAERTARGRDTREHESLLEIFQQSLAIFEADLEALRKEGTR